MSSLSLDWNLKFLGLYSQVASKSNDKRKNVCQCYKKKTPVRELMVTYLVMLRLGQEMRMAPELAPILETITSHHANERTLNLDRLMGIILYIRCARGSLVVKITDLWFTCHKFEPSTGEQPPFKGTKHDKSVESSNFLPRCSVILRRGGTSSGVVLVT
ncbi:hypothetical protein TNCV_4700811 [Trichonephila clavipes]|nr:hypothetical protein TNCV_4700811 [Trichonephila clavipes]